MKLTQSEAKTETKSTTSVSKIVMILLLAIVIIIGSIFAISAYWAEHQKQLALQQAQNIGDILNGIIPSTTPTPSIWTISMSTQGIFQQTAPSEHIVYNTNSPTDISFSTNDIRYNGQSANSYGSFAPQFCKHSTSEYFVGQYTINVGHYNWGYIYFPRGAGSPWASGVSVQMTITTNNAQGSTTFILP